MTTEIFYVVLCLIGSGFFSASETALTSLPITRLEAMRQRCGRLTRAGLDRWANAPQDLLITILVGNNLVNVLASALATRIAYRVTDTGGLAIVVGLMTLVILIFGEITPKTLAQRHAQLIAARVAPILFVLDVVLRPVNRILALLTRGLSKGGAVDVPVTEEDLHFMLRLAHRHAQLPRDSQRMIESVLRFQRAVAREVMVPRPRVVTVDAGWTAEELQLVITGTPHSRFPVVRGTPDDIVGVLHTKNLQRLAPDRHWTELVVPPVLIPEGKPLPELMTELRSSGQHLAIVLDEYGGFSGVVTLEDVLELLVGEIEDEFDLELDSEVVEVPGAWQVPGHLTLRRLEKLLHREIPSPAGVDSVGGLIADLAAGTVEPGTRVEWHDLDFVVLELAEGRTTKAQVKPRDATKVD